jgi:hypothetical protein
MSAKATVPRQEQQGGVSCAYLHDCGGAARRLRGFRPQVNQGPPTHANTCGCAGRSFTPMSNVLHFTSLRVVTYGNIKRGMHRTLAGWEPICPRLPWFGDRVFDLHEWGRRASKPGAFRRSGIFCREGERVRALERVAHHACRRTARLGPARSPGARRLPRRLAR